MMSCKAMNRWVSWASVGAALLISACVPRSPLSAPGQAQAPTVSSDTQAALSATAARTGTGAASGATATASTQRSTPQPTPAPVVAAQPRTVAVRRGPIAEVTDLNGRVAGRQEAAVSFPVRSSIGSVPVKLGQAVEQSQVVVEADAKDTVQALTQARAQVDDASNRLGDAQQQAQARQRTAITQAEDAVRGAQTNLHQVEAGAPRSERETAAAGVVSARAAVSRAEADLARLQTRVSDADLGAAIDQVEASNLALRSAEADRDRLIAGPDPVTIQVLERELAAAKSALVTAQADFDRLARGADTYQVRSAERELERAQNALKSAEATRAATKGDASVQNAAVANARLTVDEAQDGLTRLHQGPKPEDIAIARSRVDDAQAGVAAAQSKLDAGRKPADGLAVDKATAAVNAGRTALRNAQIHLQVLQAGASEDLLASASDAVESTRASLTAAETRASEVAGRPTAAELAAAQDQLASAQRSLNDARSGQANDDSAAGAVATASRELDRARAQVARLEQDLEAARLRAPFSGTVASVLVQPGDTLDAGRPAVVIATAGDPILVVTLPPTGSRSAATRVAAGQKASVSIDSGDGTQLEGSVIDVADVQTGADRTAQVQVAWSAAGPPAIGQTALVHVRVQEKQNAVLVPRSALQTIGTRKYVESLDGGARKAIDVQVGITTSADVEVLSGVQEGQAIVSGVATGDSASAAPAPPASASVATPAAVMSAPVPSPSFSVVLDDHFDTSQPDWPSSPGSTAWVEQNAYHLTARQLTRFVAVRAPVSAALGDVEVSGTFRKIGGPPGGGYGLIVRAQRAESLDGIEQSGAFLIAGVGDRGEVGMWRRNGNAWVDLLPWTRSDAVHQGSETNELRVRAIGDTLSLSVNGTEVAAAHDATLATGGVGIFVGGDVNDVLVDRFTVQAAQ